MNEWIYISREPGCEDIVTDLIISEYTEKWEDKHNILEENQIKHDEVVITSCNDIVGEYYQIITTFWNVIIYFYLK